VFGLLISKWLIDAELLARGWLLRNVPSRDSKIALSESGPAQSSELPDAPVRASEHE
jgi:hypothetical protein